jgi:hypothetical protein
MHIKARFSPKMIIALVTALNIVAAYVTTIPVRSEVPRYMEIGIDRSNLNDQAAPVRKKTLEDIHAIGAQWFRDGCPDQATSRFENFIDELKLAKQLGLKVLVILAPMGSDYDQPQKIENAGDDFCKRCGWKQGSAKFSRVNQEKLAARLKCQFEAFKAAGVSVDAFEIGNEVTWICFNGDVPNGHEPSRSEYMTALRGYARFLKTAAEIIKRSEYFPEAKIITFGMNHPGDAKHGITNSAQFVADLRNLDGFNYLDNSLYHISGYGIHIYPNATNIQNNVLATLGKDATVLRDRPFWITEWGLDLNAFPNSKLRSRSEGMQQFLGNLDSLPNIAIGPVFWYSYNINRSPGGSEIVNQEGKLLADANVLSGRARAAINTEAQLIYQDDQASGNSMTSQGEWHEFFHSPGSMMRANANYEIKFDFNITAISDQGSFYAFVRSASNPEKKSPWQEWDGKKSKKGTIRFSLETGNVDDYHLVIGIKNKGAITVHRVTIEKL